MPQGTIVQFMPSAPRPGIKIMAPASGKVHNINALDMLSHEQQYAMSLLGQGVAITVTQPQVIAPISGKVIECTPSLGKVVIQTKNKLKFLLQLPFSYTQHHGLGIHTHVKPGDMVKVSQPIMTFDLYKMQLIEKPIVLFFLLLDHKAFQAIDVWHKHINAGKDHVFVLIPKRRPAATQVAGANNPTESR